MDPIAASPNRQPQAAAETNGPKPKPLPWMIRPDWVIVWITIAYVILTGFTLLTVKRQANLMEAQLKEMHDAGERADRQLALAESELEIAHRAYLTPGMPETSLSGQTRVPIENYGKIAARVISVNTRHMQYGSDQNEIFKKERTLAVAPIYISPGKASDYAIFIDTQPLTAGVLASAIAITVGYDTGFGKTDTLIAVFSMHPKGGWVRGNTIFGSPASEQENQANT